MSKHLQFWFPCTARCGATFAVLHLVGRHRDGNCTRCTFCGKTRDTLAERKEHELLCESASEEQMNEYIQELEKSEKRKRIRRENKAMKAMQ